MPSIRMHGAVRKSAVPTLQFKYHVRTESNEHIYPTMKRMYTYENK